MGKLELRRDGGMLRHFLDGEVVEVGSRVEVLLRGGLWIAGTYDWNGIEARWPGLRFELGGAWELDARAPARPPSGVMALHPDAQLRWPRSIAERKNDAASTLSLRRAAIPRSP